MSNPSIISHEVKTSCESHKCLDCDTELTPKMPWWGYLIGFAILALLLTFENKIANDQYNDYQYASSCRYAEEEGLSGISTYAVKRSYFDCKDFIPMPKQN